MTIWVRGEKPSCSMLPGEYLQVVGVWNSGSARRNARPEFIPCVGLRKWCRRNRKAEEFAQWLPTFLNVIDQQFARRDFALNLRAVPAEIGRHRGAIVDVGA